MPEEQSIADDGENPEETRIGLFGTAYCDRLEFRFRVSRDKFETARFMAFFGLENEARDELAGSVTCRTLAPVELDYHIHFIWELSRKKEEPLVFFVSFHKGGKLPSPPETEREPYAEGFMPWFGSFFNNKTAHADSRAEFKYPSPHRRSRFLLPLKATFDGLEAEIKGLSIRFPSNKEGWIFARLQQFEKRTTVDLNGSTSVRFEDFNLNDLVGQASAFALRLTEARRP